MGKHKPRGVPYWRRCSRCDCEYYTYYKTSKICPKCKKKSWDIATAKMRGKPKPHSFFILRNSK